MPKKKPLEDVLYVRGMQEMAPILNEIEQRHRVGPIELAKALLDEACRFYEEHGWFSLPAKVIPERFQVQSPLAEMGELQAVVEQVAEEQGVYGAGAQEVRRAVVKAAEAALKKEKRKSPAAAEPRKDRRQGAA